MIDFDQILAAKVVPVVRNLHRDRAASLADALARGGMGTIEVTVESDGGYEAISALQDSALIVGAGTVLSLDAAKTAARAGARYLVSPSLDLELIEWARQEQIPYLPGVFSPTEAHQAMKAGCRHVKLFPAGIGGPALVRALLGPLPGLRIVVTGGIDGTNAASFLEAGAVAVGVGDWLSGHSDLSLVTTRAREVVGAISDARLS